MKILVGQFHLNTIGGTETFTYTLIKELVKQGHKVELITLHPGYVSNLIQQQFGIVANQLTYNYDLSLVNHNVVVDKIRTLGIKTKKLIQTCHGTIPPLEKPSSNADYHVAISKEIEHDINLQGFTETSVIMNGIDCERFCPIKPLNEKITKILSLTQSEQSNIFLNDVCSILECQLQTLNKNRNPKFDIEHDINDADLVVGLGRSAYDALACGRPVFVWDNRSYQGSLGDGYLTKESFSEFIKNNCSGRRYKKIYSPEQVANEINENYNSKSSDIYRKLALNEFNITKQVQKYLGL